MTRNKKRSSAENLVVLIALMPWWAGCVLAPVSYLWLHSVVTQGAAPLNPAMVNDIARKLGLEVSVRAGMNETIPQIRAALECGH